MNDLLVQGLRSAAHAISDNKDSAKGVVKGFFNLASGIIGNSEEDHNTRSSESGSSKWKYFVGGAVGVAVGGTLSKAASTVKGFFSGSAASPATEDLNQAVAEASVSSQGISTKIDETHARLMQDLQALRDEHDELIRELNISVAKGKEYAEIIEENGYTIEELNAEISKLKAENEAIRKGFNQGRYNIN